MIRLKKSIAFTLAEVLLSLSILGVVSALTIPSVLHTNEIRANAALLKKAVTKLDEVVQMASIEPEFQPRLKCYYTTSGRIITHCEDFYKYMLKSLKVVKSCNEKSKTSCAPEYTAYDTIITQEDNETDEDYEKRIKPCTNWTAENLKSRPTFVTNDGMIFIANSEQHPDFAIDVNGKRGPNKMGYDVFFLQLEGSSGYTPSFRPGSGCEYKAPGGKTTAEMLKGKY